ncbi:hypothetical protein DINM_003448 [Dirofilaria immitis]|nr:hypothetical protein [Dirofilaria immitis]
MVTTIAIILSALLLLQLYLPLTIFIGKQIMIDGNSEEQQSIRVAECEGNIISVGHRRQISGVQMEHTFAFYSFQRIFLVFQDICISRINRYTEMMLTSDIEMFLMSGKFVLLRIAAINIYPVGKCVFTAVIEMELPK